MDILIDNPILSALMQSVQVERNIEAEALRKAKIKEQTARAMDRASNEWR
jgi:hypothetical protein